MEDHFVHFTNPRQQLVGGAEDSSAKPEVLWTKDEEAYRLHMDQKQRLTNDSLNTLEGTRSFRQFLLLWMVLLTALTVIMLAYVFPMHHNVQYLLDLHEDDV